MFRRRLDMRVEHPQATAEPVRPLKVDIDLSDLVDAAAPTPAPDRGWLESSRDLQRGMRMRELPLDSLTAELIDALLRRRL
jgi:hypothetical protein